MIHRTVAFVVLIWIVTACTSGSPPRIYVLSNAVDTPVEAKSGPEKAVIQLQRILLPDYLDTTDILMRAGQHELRPSPTARWGERLSLGVTHALATDLAARLPLDRVILAYPTDRYARQILVDVDTFDIWPNGHCVLSATWTLIDDKAVLIAGRGTFITAPGQEPPGDATVVTGMADAVAKLADSLASAIAAPPGANK
jgi:hypothetical protein